MWFKNKTLSYMIKRSLAIVPRPHNGESSVSSTNGVRKLDIHMQNNKVRSLPTQKLSQSRLKA